MTAVGGIDTWSVGWYLADDSAADRAAVALCSARAGRFDLAPEEVAGHRVLYDRTNRFLMAEGHPQPEALCPIDAATLTECHEAIAAELQDRDLVVDRRPARFDRQGSPGFAGVRRLDVAVDAERGSITGRAMLNAVAAVEPPGRLRSTVHRARALRAIETVTWEGARGKVSRVYDKGVESGTLAAGERIRFEDQRRFAVGSRPMPEELAAGYAAHLFRERFRPLCKATKGLIVTNQARLAERISELVEEGALTPAEAAKLTGLVVLQHHGVEVGSRTTRWRNRVAVGRLGLVLADGVVEEDEIDLGAEFEQVVGAAFVSDRDREAEEWSGGA